MFTQQCLKSDCCDGRSVLKQAPWGRVTLCFPEWVRAGEKSGVGTVSWSAWNWGRVVLMTTVVLTRCFGSQMTYRAADIDFLRGSSCHLSPGREPTTHVLLAVWCGSEWGSALLTFDWEKHVNKFYCERAEQACAFYVSATTLFISLPCAVIPI